MVKKHFFLLALYFLYEPLNSWAEPISLSLGLNSDSKYISQGRDNLSKGGLYSTYLEAETGNWYAGAWAATGSEADYDERNLWLSRSITFGQFELLPSFTYLTFSEDDSDDHEYSLELIANSNEQSAVSLLYTYSKFSAGGFWELKLQQEFNYYQVLSLTPKFVLAQNDGYIRNEHKGLNNAILGIDFHYSLGVNLALTGYYSHSWALNKKRGESLENITWYGIGLVFNPF